MSTITHERLRADALRQWQSHYDEQIFRKIGMRAPEPVADQSVLNYRQETCRTIKRLTLPQENKYYQLQWRGLDTAAINALEPGLLEEGIKQFNNPANVPPGEIRMIPRTDGYGKIQYYDALGQESFVKQMGRPGRRVVCFRAPVDASGRTLSPINPAGRIL